MSDFVKNPLSEIINVTGIYTLHYFEYSKTYNFEGETHPFWELVYVDRGNVSVIADKQIYRLNQGEIIFHKPNEFHAIKAMGDYANTVVISFETKSPAMVFFENKVLKLNKSQREIIFKIISEGKNTFSEPLNIVELTEMTKREIIDFGSLQLIKLYMEELFIQLIRSNSVLKAREKNPQWRKQDGGGDVFGIIVDYLERNTDKNVTIDDVCNQFFFSKTYIKTLFKQKTGKGMINYFNDLKIKKAKQLISLGEFTFTEIAEILSYGSVHYFSRSFKEYTGMTPTEYSKSVKSTGIL
ncbi:MAG: helix-turn-helix transcriptional regulator [Clostridia bacterium]|nr:helix-turn-helix transcriptional regulator [Clostridia bacterium]